MISGGGGRVGGRAGGWGVLCLQIGHDHVMRRSYAHKDRLTDTRTDRQSVRRASRDERHGRKEDGRSEI